MKRITVIAFIVIFGISAYAQNIQSGKTNRKIDRKAIVDRHKVITTSTLPDSPAQVGNGEFAFGVDITGLQTFVPFNTMSHWSWHSNPLPAGKHIEDFNGALLNTHGRMVQYAMEENEDSEIATWLSQNPHRFSLGRVGFILLKSNGKRATESDLKNTHQEIDLWNGIITSYFELEGKLATVKTACHSTKDVIGVSVNSELIKSGQLKIELNFSYPNPNGGDMDNKSNAHTSLLEKLTNTSARIDRKLDATKYSVYLHWTSQAKLVAEPKHRFVLQPEETNNIEFTCAFTPQKVATSTYTSNQVFSDCATSWSAFWKSGAAIDLSESKDNRWRELERRIVLSQYLMKVNEAGSYPPQESGLVNNGWFGRFHFEMIWWHGVHYALWNRWPLLVKSMHVYKDYLPTSIERAKNQGYAGVRWPKCTANIDREWPHPIHALLIWQQPHPIYFAELDYRLHPTKATLEKWRNIVFETANFMANYAYLEKEKNRYILGPPLYIVSENTDPINTSNPTFELGYWRYGLSTAQRWKERLGLDRDKKWDDVLTKLSALPQQEGVYVTHENIENMWTKYNFEHPGLIGVYGMLPGYGVDTVCFKRTLDKIAKTWNFNRTWGWDFPMLAMAAARSGNPELAVEFLLKPYGNFQFDVHGLATGGPFPYFPSNGGLLTAVAMMAAGWDGAQGETPGFPKNANWVVKYENFNRMQ